MKWLAFHWQALAAKATTELFFVHLGNNSRSKVAQAVTVGEPYLFDKQTSEGQVGSLTRVAGVTGVTSSSNKKAPVLACGTVRASALQNGGLHDQL